MGRQNKNLGREEIEPIISRVNLLPRSEVELVEFRVLMEPVLELFDSYMASLYAPGENDFTDPFATSDPFQQEKHEWTLAEFETQVEKKIDSKYWELGKHIGPVPVAAMNAAIRCLQLERDSLLALIASASFLKRGRYMPALVTRSSFVMVNADFTISEIKPSLVSVILDKRIKIDRLGVCPICGKIFWQTIIREKARQTETCGNQKCVTGKQTSKQASKKEKK